MHKTEQMIIDFQSPMVKLNHTPPCLTGRRRSLHSMGDSQELQAIPFQRLDMMPRTIFRRWDMHRLSKITFRAAVDCLAMAGFVLSGALATLLLGF